MNRRRSSCPQHKSWPKVTVIVVNWNGGRFIERCLAALMNQTVKPPRNHLYWIMQALTDRLRLRISSSSIRLIALDQNTGFARGNNLSDLNVLLRSLSGRVT